MYRQFSYYTSINTSERIKKNMGNNWKKYYRRLEYFSKVPLLISDMTSSNFYTNTKYYKSDIPIIKNRFIYTSDISRGLDLLIDCLLFIQNTIPDISLVVFRKDGFYRKYYY